MEYNYFVIKDLEDKRVQDFRSLKLGNIQSDIYIVEGAEPIRQALLSKDVVVQLFVTLESKDYWQGILGENLNSFSNQVPEILLAEKELMSEIVGFHLHQGFLAKVKRPSNHFDNSKLKFPILALNGIEKSENVGAIVRTALCFRISSVMFDKGTCSPYVRRAVRVSMGAVCHCDILEVANLKEKILEWRDNFVNFHVVSLEQSMNSKSYLDVSFSRNSIIILGGETKGVDRDLLNISDQIVEVPMDSSHVRSLNVAVSAGILLSAFSKFL